MSAVLVVCAALGGSILVLQFILALVGMGGHALDVDMPQDVDFHLDGDGFDAGHDAHAHDALGLFKIISFRTVVAALAFFGLSGLAAQSADCSTPTVLLVAVAGGGAAMAAVYWMMRGLYELRADGTERIQRAVGRPGVVYLRVPGFNSGSGKVQVNLQNRTVEFQAVTAGPELPTGANILVAGVVDPSTLEVCRDPSTLEQGTDS